MTLSLLNTIYLFSMITISITYNSMFLTSYMLQTFLCRLFFMDVDPIEANQRMKSFYPSSVPTMDDDAVIIFSSSRKTTKTSKIRLPPWLHAPYRSTYLHSNQSPHLPHYSCTLWCVSPTHPLAFYHYLHIVYAPLASSTSILVWTTKMRSACSHHFIDF